MPRKRPGETLTDKQRAFCNEYVIELNATAAAIKAGYSEDSARSTGSHLLDDPDVGAYIRQLQEEKFIRLRITADAVLAELVKIGFAEVEDFEETQDARPREERGRRQTQDGKAESQRILASLSFKKGETFRDANGKIVEAETQDPAQSGAGAILKTQDLKEDHSMVKRAAMSYKRVVVDERTGTKTTYTFTLRDKIMALRIIAQHLGMFIPDKTKQKMQSILIAPKGRVFDNENAVKNDNPDKGSGQVITK